MKFSTLLVAAFAGLFFQKTSGQSLQIFPPPLPLTFCDYSTNDPLQWNAGATYNPFGIANTWSPIYQSNDLPEGTVDLSVMASDDCPVNNIDFKYLLSLDLNGDGSMETVIDSEIPVLGFGIREDEVDGAFRTARVTRDFETDDPEHTKFASFSLPYGNHKIKWFAAGCGQNDTLEYAFTIKDCKKPTVVCINGLSISQVNAPANGQPAGVTLWAGDFLLYAEDNSTNTYNLDIAMRDPDINPGTGFPLMANGLPQASLFWDCSTQLGTNAVELWAKDKAGNEDFCNTYLILSDNFGSYCHPYGVNTDVCIYPPCNSSILFNNVAEVTFSFNTQSPGMPNPGLFYPNPVNSTGCYDILANLPLGPNYSVTPKKDINPLNGVSTFDLVRMSKHILNNQPFTSPLQFVAADINNNKQVTTFDIVELRKLILGIYTDFPNNDSWRFVLRNQNFGDPFWYSNWVEYCPIVATATCDFDAVKIGDLTCDAISNNFANETSEDRSPALFSLENRELAAGQTIEIPIFSENETALLAWQMALKFDPNFIEITESPDVSEAAPMLAVTAPGRAAMNWFSDAPRQFLGARDALISLKIKVLRDCKLADVLFLENENLAPEAYFSDEKSQPISLIFSDKKPIAAAQNLTAWPNPFSENTTLEWSLLEAAEVSIDVFDATSRAVYSTKFLGEKGANRYLLDGLSDGLFFVKMLAGPEIFSTTIFQKN